MAVFKVSDDVLNTDKELIQALIDIIDTYKLDLKALKNNAKKQITLLEDNYGV